MIMNQSTDFSGHFIKKKLYTSQLKLDQCELLDKLFANLSIPTLSEEQRQAIEISEIFNCIRGLANGKAPGLDDFTAEFFKGVPLCFFTF